MKFSLHVRSRMLYLKRYQCTKCMDSLYIKLLYSFTYASLSIIFRTHLARSELASSTPGSLYGRVKKREPGYEARSEHHGLSVLVRMHARESWRALLHDSSAWN